MSLPTIYIIGASIGFAIGLQMSRLPGIKDKYRVKNLCRKGAKFLDLVWPKASEVKENDIILIFPFGNDLQKGKYSRDAQAPRAFHLLEFVGIDDATRDLYYALLMATVERYQAKQAKIFIVTCFYRFLCPCHIYPNFLKFYMEQNRYMFQTFANFENVKVLDHRTLVSDQVGKAKRDSSFYASLLYDQVHFKDNSVIARRIFAHFP